MFAITTVELPFAAILFRLSEPSELRTSRTPARGSAPSLPSQRMASRPKRVCVWTNVAQAGEPERLRAVWVER